MSRTIRKVKNKLNWLRPIQFNGGGGSKTVASAGRVYIQVIDVPFDCFANGIYFQTGGTAAGQARGGIYGPLATIDNPSGDARVADSGAVTTTTTFSTVALTFSNTRLAAGQYVIAIAFSDITCTYIGNSSVFIGKSTCAQQFDQAFGAMPSTLPALTTNSTNQPAAVLSVTPL